MLRARLCSTLVLSLAACSGQARAPAAVPINGEAAGSAANPGARGGDDDAGFPAVPMTASGDAFAALLEERTRALLSAAASGLVHLGERPRRTTIVRVIWQTITSDPVARIEAMAFLLPDGRLRWGVLGALKPSGGIQVASGLAYPQGLLAEGLRRPLAAGEGDCDLPMIPLVDLATLPQVAREDTFLHGYGRADACRLRT